MHKALQKLANSSLGRVRFPFDQTSEKGRFLFGQDCDRHSLRWACAATTRDGHLRQRLAYMYVVDVVDNCSTCVVLLHALQLISVVLPPPSCGNFEALQLRGTANTMANSFCSGHPQVSLKNFDRGFSRSGPETDPRLASDADTRMGWLFIF